jgi:hypothetical protein
VASQRTTTRKSRHLIAREVPQETQHVQEAHALSLELQCTLVWHPRVTEH